MEPRRIVIVGAGASGLAAAVTAARLSCEVTLVEASDRCGHTILATGNGRCNIANAHLSPDAYNNPSFVRHLVGPEAAHDVLAFFEGMGLWCETDERGQCWPRSRAASSVVNVLLRELRLLGVRVVNETAARGVHVVDGGLVVDLAGASGIATRRVVWAAGGGSFCETAHDLRLPYRPDGPVLLPLACDRRDVAGLDGVRARCVAHLTRDGATVWSEDGEVLFRKNGVSGIVVFNASRLALPHDMLTLDLVPDVSERELCHMLRGLHAHTGEQTQSFLDGLVHPALGRACVARANSEGRLDPQLCAHVLKHFDIVVTGTSDKTPAQVTRGGLACEAVDPLTMECRTLPGLFICGEALDVDGPCGGYNLSWAWLSGMAAGRAAARSYGAE